MPDASQASEASELSEFSNPDSVDEYAGASVEENDGVAPPTREAIVKRRRRDTVLAWLSHVPLCRATRGGRTSTHVGMQGRTLTWRRGQGIISERIVV